MRITTITYILIMQAVVACKQEQGSDNSFSPSKESIQANEANREAIYNIGLEYLLGTDSTEQNSAKALDYILSAAKAGHTSAECHLAYSYYRGDIVRKDYNECVKWCAKAAEKGFDKALCVLNDIGVKPYPKATRKFVKNEKFYLKWNK